MRNATVFLAFAVTLPLAAQQQTVTCSSNGGSQACPADTRNGVLLVHEQSNNVCRQGQTWSFDRRGITVNGGCSADFLVNPQGSRYGSGNGYGNRTYGSGVDAFHTNGNATDRGQYNNGGSRVSIPQGTQIGFRTEQAVRQSELNQNDIVTGTLANDLVVNGQTVAPAGTPVQAKVMSVSGSSLDLRLDSMQVNGTTYTLQSNSVRGIRDAVSTQNSSGGGLGGVLNSLAGTIPSGTVFNFRLTNTARAQ